MFTFIAKAVTLFGKVYHWISTIGSVVVAVDKALRTLSAAYRSRRMVQAAPPRRPITQYPHQDRRFYSVPPVDDEDDLDDGL